MKKKLCEIIEKEFSDQNEDSDKSPLIGSPQSNIIIEDFFVCPPQSNIISEDFFECPPWGSPQSNIINEDSFIFPPLGSPQSNIISENNPQWNSISEEEEEKENQNSQNNIVNFNPNKKNSKIVYNNIDAMRKDQENDGFQNLGNLQNLQNIQNNEKKFSAISFPLINQLIRNFSTQENTSIKKANNNSNNFTFNNTNNNPNNFILNNLNNNPNNFTLNNLNNFTSNNSNISTFTNNNEINNNNFDIKRINEEKNNEPQNQEINNNLPKNGIVKDQVKKNTNYENRNLQDSFVKRFFKDFVIFINALIGIYKNENKNAKYLQEINGKYYIQHSLMNKYNMLKNSAYDSLIFKNGLPKIFQQKENEKNPKIKAVEKKIKRNICIIYSIFNNKNENNKKECIIEVLKKPIFELMDIYLNRKIPKEEYYTKFPRFENYLIKKNKNVNEKNNLLKVAYNYEKIIIKSINEAEHKIGRKARNEIGEIITHVKDFRD